MDYATGTYFALGAGLATALVLLAFIAIGFD